MTTTKTGPNHANALVNIGLVSNRDANRPGDDADGGYCLISHEPVRFSLCPIFGPDNEATENHHGQDI